MSFLLKPQKLVPSTIESFSVLQKHPNVVPRTMTSCAALQYNMNNDEEQAFASTDKG